MINFANSLPIFQPHICSRCDIQYILFKKGAVCPNCKLLENIDSHTNFKFVKNLLDIMRIHKRRHGQYTPNVWFVESVCDEMSQICFHVFDRLERQNAISPVNKIKKILDEIDWRGKLYLKIHSREIVAELYKRYLEKKPRHSFLSKIKSVFAM